MIVISATFYLLQSFTLPAMPGLANSITNHSSSWLTSFQAQRNILLSTVEKAKECYDPEHQYKCSAATNHHR